MLQSRNINLIKCKFRIPIKSTVNATDTTKPTANSTIAATTTTTTTSNQLTISKSLVSIGTQRKQLPQPLTTTSTTSAVSSSSSSAAAAATVTPAAADVVGPSINFHELRYIDLYRPKARVRRKSCTAYLFSTTDIKTTTTTTSTTTSTTLTRDYFLSTKEIHQENRTSLLLRKRSSTNVEFHKPPTKIINIKNQEQQQQNLLPFYYNPRNPPIPREPRAHRILFKRKILPDELSYYPMYGNAIYGDEKRYCLNSVARTFKRTKAAAASRRHSGHENNKRYKKIMRHYKKSYRVRIHLIHDAKDDLPNFVIDMYEFAHCEFQSKSKLN